MPQKGVLSCVAPKPCFDIDWLCDMINIHLRALIHGVLMGYFLYTWIYMGLPDPLHNTAPSLF